MGEVKTKYTGTFEGSDWDALIRQMQIARLVDPTGDLSLGLTAASADDLMEVLKRRDAKPRDRVVVVEIEVERCPQFLDAVFWGFGLWAFFDFAAAFVRGLLS